MTTITQNGYLAKITKNPSSNTYRGEIINAVGVPDFEAASYKDLTKAFQEMLQRYEKDCKGRGEKLAVPY